MITIRDICTAYLDAYILAKQAEWLIYGKIQGSVLDSIKKHEQWADLALEGVKDRLRESGKIEE